MTVLRKVRIEGTEYNGDGNFQQGAVTHEGFQQVSLAGISGQGPFGLFNEMVTTHKIPTIDLKSVYGITALRDGTTVTNAATITQTGGEYKLNCTAAGTDSAILESKERGRYVAGQASECGLGVRLTGTLTGNQVQRWGAFTDTDGFGFGRDATGIFVFRRKSSVDTKVYQTNWNVDPLDGAGIQQLTIDVTKGQIFQIVYSWYGYGVIEFRVVQQDVDTNQQKSVIVHRIKVDSETSVADPNLPIRAEIDNDGTAATQDMYIGGRQYSVMGESAPSRRITSDYRLAVSVASTAWEPLISFQKKTGFETMHSIVSGLDIITDQGIIVAVFQDPTTLTGASFGTPTDGVAAETAMESDIAATAITGGIPLWFGLATASGGGANRSGGAQTDLPHIDVPDNEIITLAAKAVSTTASVSAAFRLQEDW